MRYFRLQSALPGNGFSLVLKGDLGNNLKQLAELLEVESIFTGPQAHVVKEVLLIVQSKVNPVLLVDCHELRSRNQLAANLPQALVPQAIQFLRVHFVLLEQSQHSGQQLVAALLVLLALGPLSIHRVVLVSGNVLQPFNHRWGLGRRFLHQNLQGLVRCAYFREGFRGAAFD